MSRTSADRFALPQGDLPFTRPLDVDKMPDDGLSLSIEADPAECAAIARATDLPAVARLEATYRVSRLPGGRVQVDGTLAARITQICVVSLEPFESDVSQAIELTFAPMKAPLPAGPVRKRRERNAAQRSVAHPEAVAVPLRVEAGEDPPDPIIDGRIDLGSVAVEFLTLALDLYPKKPGVHFTDVLIGETDDTSPSAFAALARFKDRS